MITKELAQAVLDAPSACKDFKEIAAKYIDSIGTPDEAKYAEYLVKEAKEDINTIDDTVAFLSSEMAPKVFGSEEVAKEKLKNALEAKANGAQYCDCPGCVAAKAIIDNA